MVDLELSENTLDKFLEYLTFYRESHKDHRELALDHVLLRTFMRYFDLSPDDAFFVQVHTSLNSKEVGGDQTMVVTGEEAKVSGYSEDNLVHILKGYGKMEVGKDPPEGGWAIPNHTVSKHHADIEKVKDIGTFIEDAGSTNGTFIDKERLLPKRKSLLANGSTVHFSPFVGYRYFSSPARLYESLHLYARTKGIFIK